MTVSDVPAAHVLGDSLYVSTNADQFSIGSQEMGHSALFQADTFAINQWTMDDQWVQDSHLGSYSQSLPHDGNRYLGESTSPETTVMRELQRMASMATREESVLYGLQPQGGCQAGQEMVALPSSIYSSGENSYRDWEPEWFTQD